MQTPDWWYQPKSWQASLLQPVAYLLQQWSQLQWQKYKNGLMQIWQPPVPTVIVGNLTVGGTGKTPMTLFLSKLLRKQGYKPAIISKGYGGSHSKTSKQVHLVQPNDAVSLVGDEPLLMSFAKIAPVLIGHNRIQMIETAVAQLHADCVVVDDGLHDYSFRHDVEICMLDGIRHLGNRLCLPAGPLREWAGRIDTVDCIIENSVNSRQSYAQAHGIMQLKLNKAINLLDGRQQALHHFVAKQSLAVAGIGHPQRFFQQIQQQVEDIQCQAFSDHHVFQMRDLPANVPVLMTSKDAVKCRDFSADNFWEVPAEPLVSESIIKRFCRLFRHKINHLRNNH